MAAAFVDWDLESEASSERRRQCIVAVAGRFKFFPFGHSAVDTSSSRSRRISSSSKYPDVYLTVDSTSLQGVRVVFADPPTGYLRLSNPPDTVAGSVLVFERGATTFSSKYEQAVALGAACVLIVNDRWMMCG